MRYPRGHLAGEELGHGRFHAETPAGVLLPRGLAHQQPRRVYLRAHVREHELDGLELRNGVAEGHALLRVLQRRLERALGNAHGLRPDADAPAVERRERHLVAFALVADAVFLRHGAIRKDQLAARRRADAQLLLFLAHLEARRALFHHQRGDALFALGRVGVHVDDGRIRRAAVGDPGLRAVEHIGVALLHRPGLQRRGVRAGLRFGQRVAADLLPAREG